MAMNGQAVFNYVVDIVPEYAQEFMDELETAPEEYEKLVLHQANCFMLRKLAKAIGFDYKTQMPICMDKYGNTSSVSIPLTICSELQGGVGHILGIGMGAGLATGIMDINLNNIKNYGVHFVDL